MISITSFFNKLQITRAQNKLARDQVRAARKAIRNNDRDELQSVLSEALDNKKFHERWPEILEFAARHGRAETFALALESSNKGSNYSICWNAFLPHGYPYFYHEKPLLALAIESRNESVARYLIKRPDADLENGGFFQHMTPRRGQDPLETNRERYPKPLELARYKKLGSVVEELEARKNNAKENTGPNRRPNPAS